MLNRLTLAAVALLVLVNLVLVYAVFRRESSPPGSRTAPVDGARSGQATASASPAPRVTSASPGVSAPSASAPASAGASRQASRTARATPTNSSTGTASRARGQIQLGSASYFAAPFQTVSINGTYPGAPARTKLRVQHQQAGGWTPFPLPAATDASGRFTVYVEIGRRGRYRLRVVDPSTRVASAPVTLYVG